tara:strand:- start:734 stop:886 length:153 start_codon:yes stop_codon:yes gene_type:complete
MGLQPIPKQAKKSLYRHLIQFRTKTKAPKGALEKLTLVAGAGFEPTTYGL